MPRLTLFIFEPEVIVDYCTAHVIFNLLVVTVVLDHILIV